MKTVGIARRMAIFLAAFAVVTFGVVLAMTWLSHTATVNAQGLQKKVQEQSNSSLEVIDELAKLQGLTQRLVREKDPDTIESLIRDGNALVQSSQDAIRSGKDASVQVKFSTLVSANEEVKNLLLRGQVADAQQTLIEKSNPAFEAVLVGLTEEYKKTARNSEEEFKHMDSRAASIEGLIAILAIGSVGVVVGYGLILRRGIVTRLRTVVDRVKDIAEGEGDLTQRIRIVSDDEIGELSHWFNMFIDKLQTIIRQVSSSTQQLASACEQISESAKQMAIGAGAQQNQTAQVATAMQEMSASVTQVSGNASLVAEHSLAAVKDAREGGQVAERAVEMMCTASESVDLVAQQIADLGRRSDQIGKIVGVIDEIADQTNLLALNAAIEAARAGEQGRGFAVVADEVRKLAERTTTATKEIAGMIASIQNETKVAVGSMEKSAAHVQQGVEAIRGAGTRLELIIEGAEKAAEMITQIAAASSQQASTTDEINSNINEIARISNESAGGAQESAKACEHLSVLASDLQLLVRKFKVENAAVREQSSVLKRHAPQTRPRPPAPIPARVNPNSRGERASAPMVN
ncbi:MAG TPA: methyl-accepting chemotaxis protein [Terriglobales bacterium]|nr:methyl-accepting chemotaxis protein [Terriglobales bacterium]